MVDLIGIRKLITQTRRSLKEAFHQSISPKCAMIVGEEYLLEKEEETRLEIPRVLKEILTKYGTHRLNFRIPDPQKANRYIFGHGTFYGEYSFDYGGFNKFLTYKDNREVLLDIPGDHFILLEDLNFGKLIVLKDWENKEHLKDIEVYLFEYPDKFSRLSINLDQYMTLLPQTFGMYCWQEYLTNNNYLLDGSIPDNFHANMQQLFPEVNLNIFRDPPKLTDSVFNRFIASPNKVDYRKKFIDVMDQLEANPNVQFKHYEQTDGYIVDGTSYTARYGVTEAVLRKIKKDYGREVSEQMLSFYHQMNGSRADWVFKDAVDGEKYVEGKINFLPLEEVMGGKWNQTYLDWSSPDLFKDEDAVYHFSRDEASEYPEFALLMQKGRIFDEQGEMRDYFIEFAEGQEEPNIYKIVNTDFYKMEIDFKTFINARIEFAGIKGWEYKFYEGSDYSDNDRTVLIDGFKQKVRLVLPDAEFEKFNL